MTAAVELSPDEQLALIRRGSEKILPDEQALGARLERSAAEGRPLRVKLGIDPTFTDLTLGHTIPLRNLRRFQDMGHQAVLVIGDYTATVGDPSGRSKARPPLTHEEVLANAATYQEQAGKILDLERAEVVWNSDWLRKLTLRELIQICGHVSVKQMLQGEYFGRRFEDPDQTIYMHEMFYPIMQGMDSVAVRADVELGGTDQEFNCLMGRDMQRLHGQEPQIVVSSPLLLGLTGHEKMSKSLGNFVGVSWPAQEQFNRLMSMSDDRMPDYFRLLTNVPLEEIDGLIAAVRRGEADPRDAKKRLATEIVASLHGADAARSAAQEYERYAGLRRAGSGDVELPSNLREAAVSLQGDSVRLVSAIVQAGLAGSNGEAKRLARQGGVRLRGEVVRDDTRALGREEVDGALLQVGSRPPVVLRAKE
ncbi:MAG: tyrosine--tRNA ligase [Chloroflexota bacterium]|nr:tyrosine--tRNA ligase [Chloroflexota bacterium]